MIILRAAFAIKNNAEMTQLLALSLYIIYYENGVIMVQKYNSRPAGYDTTCIKFHIPTAIPNGYSYTFIQ